LKATAFAGESQPELKRISVPHEESYPDHEMLEAHRQFVKRLHLSNWRPISPVKAIAFDGWRGSVAYELD
jgi:hypothetical protein